MNSVVAKLHSRLVEQVVGIIEVSVHLVFQGQRLQHLWYQAANGKSRYLNRQKHGKSGGQVNLVVPLFAGPIMGKINAYKVYILQISFKSLRGLAAVVGIQI